MTAKTSLKHRGNPLAMEGDDRRETLDLALLNTKLRWDRDCVHLESLLLDSHPGPELRGLRGFLRSPPARRSDRPTVAGRITHVGPPGSEVASRSGSAREREIRQLELIVSLDELQGLDMSVIDIGACGCGRCKIDV